MEARVTKLEADARNHDEVCATRWGILLKVIGYGGTFALTILLGVAGFGMKALYEGQQHQLEVLQRVSTQVAAVPLSPPSQSVVVQAPAANAQGTPAR